MGFQILQKKLMPVEVGFYSDGLKEKIMNSNYLQFASHFKLKCIEPKPGEPNRLF